MKKLLLFCMYIFCCIMQLYAEEEKTEISQSDKWERTNERNNCSPKLYQDDSFVYVYSDKQLDNLTIGITDMQGNVYYEEVTTVPAGIYYAISIESLPVGQSTLIIMQTPQFQS